MSLSTGFYRCAPVVFLCPALMPSFPALFCLYSLFHVIRLTVAFLPRTAIDQGYTLMPAHRTHPATPAKQIRARLSGN